MSRNAALLIDLENFYLAREVTEGGDSDEPYDFVRDLERLTGFARELVGSSRRLIVRRAYADFSASRLYDDVEAGRPRRDYFLRSVPTLLMDQGVEPVQVFRFPGGGRGVAKNAADMRLAMDAIGLVSDVDFFILVTGDKDFIPLVLELRQRGAYVVGLGAHGSIARTLAAYCDELHEFETLVAADEAQGGEPGHAIATTTTTTTISGLPHVVSVPAEPPPHTVPLYRRLLMMPSKVRLRIHEARVWQSVTEHVYGLATSPEGTHQIVFQHELRSSVIDQLADDGEENPGRAANDTLFLVFKAGCFVCADPGPRFGQTDFNWTNHGARLSPGITSVQQLRQRAYAFVVERLAERLRDHDGRPPEPRLVAELFFGPEPTEEELERAERLVSVCGSVEEDTG